MLVLSGLFFALPPFLYPLVEAPGALLALRSMAMKLFVRGRLPTSSVGCTNCLLRWKG